MPCKHFHPTFFVFFFNFSGGGGGTVFMTRIVTTLQSMRSPVVSGGATGLHFIMCFLFGRERQNWAFSQLEMGGGGLFWCKLRAGNDGSCLLNERPSRKKKKKNPKRQDRHGTRETPPASSTPVQIYVEKQHTVICFSPHNEMKWRCIYSYVSYTTKNQASDHNLVIL